MGAGAGPVCIQGYSDVYPRFLDKTKKKPLCFIYVLKNKEEALNYLSWALFHHSFSISPIFPTPLPLSSQE
jgi:hypothetical protein